MKKTERDDLDRLLETWQVEVSAGSDFQRNVWHRIATDQEDLPWTEQLLSWWLMPRRLLASVSVALVLGGGLALLDHGMDQTEARRAYFSAINPMDQNHLQTHYAIVK